MKPLENLLNCKKPYAIFLLIITLSLTNLYSQQLAFPSANGAGSYTTGGRGLGVYHVTNLNNSGAGSLRQAVIDADNAGGGTIVFDISGVINITSTLGFTDNLTVAGQTAPEGGITIDGERVFVSGVDNLIVRYIRFKGGIDGGDDSVTVRGDVTNQIWDHCSFSFGDDEAASWYETQSNKTVDNLTVQRCLFGENSKGSIVGGQTGGATTGNISFNKNLFYNTSHRFPNASGVNANIEVINNIVWGVGSRLVRVNGENQNLNHIGNYYDFGERGMIDDRLHMFSYETGYPNIYTYGNKIVGQSPSNPLTYSLTEMNADNTLSWKHFIDGTNTPLGTRNKGDQLESQYFSNTQHPLLGNTVTITTADEALVDVRENVGCNARLNEDGSISDNLDVLDQEWLNNVNQNIHTTFLTTTNYTVPEIISINRENNFYQSNPHIPEVWFSANVPSGQDHNDIAPSGYTWLEEYLNQVDNTAPIPVVNITGVNITPDTAEILTSETVTLSVTVTPSDATDQSGVWSSSDETIATVDENGVVTPVSEGEVTITFITNDGGFSDSSVITVLPEAFEANAGLDQTICQGESVVLLASGGTTYLWSNGETTDSIEVAPTVTTTYTVTAFDDFGNSDDDSVTVTVNELPNAEAGDNQTICLGEIVTLTASGGNDYLWSNGETTASISVSPTSSTVYTVEVTTNGCSSTDDVTVFVNTIPEITISDNVTIMNGETTTLTATGGDNYIWSTGETTPSIEVSPIETTTYTVTSSNGNCEATAQVTVTVIPELVVDAGEDVVICNGEEVVLTASGGVSYTWSTGETSSQITVSPATTTTYTVTAEDNFGNSDSDTVTVTVNELPILTITEDLTIIEGETVQLNVSGASTYEWSTGETGDTITVNPNTTTTYFVIGTTETCSSQAQVTVTVEEVLIVSAGQDENVCEDDSYDVVLTASPGDSYLWSTGATTQSIIVSPLSTTTYSVTVTSGIQEDTDDVTVFVNPNPDVVILNGESVDIMSGDFVTLSASGANTYEWNNGATQPNIAVSPSQTTTYEVRGYIGDCYDEKQVTVNVIPEVEADAGEDQEICLGDVVTLVASGGDEYVWSTGETTQSIQVSPAETTEYTVTVFNALDFDEDTVTVFVDTNCNDVGVIDDPIDDPVDGAPLEFEFSVFPNPANEYVDIKLSGSDQLTSFYIYDLTGKLIYQRKVENESLSVSSTTRVDVSSLRPGIYLVKLVDIKRDLYKRLIVK
ncbi:Ig-like domain-containing protein [Winogradskyella poriferorum]|uniref:Ig-like domain-containing protein n=1 Tax=Winogradskyella poriferorum TaxID=307627 RepID=A0ABU7W541_9FLAO